MDASKKRLVVKIGSSTLTTAAGRIDHEFLSDLAAQVQAVRSQGWEVVIVSSGAIACGLERLSMGGARPEDLPTLQAAASVGQGLFASAYESAFGQQDILTSLVLLTRRDTADRTAYLHARDTMERLLALGVVPVVNENDTVSVEEIRFGDNDTLCALVACLIRADLAVIMSDIDGLYDANPSANPEAKLLKVVEAIDDSIIQAAGDAGSAMGSGGMATKVKAARVLRVAGIPLVVCEGRKPNVIVSVVNGEEVGTKFSANAASHEITPRKLWLALGDAAKGAVIVDGGAKAALQTRGSSLLAVGVSAVEGDFDAGDIVDIKDESGFVVGRGKITAAKDSVDLARGRSNAELLANKLLADLADKPLIHRDDMVLFD